MNELERRLSEKGVLALVTGPTVEPVGLDEVKAHSRIGITEDDLLIQEKILAVRTWVERWTDLKFITQTWTISFRRFFPEFEIPVRPVQSITKIEYISTLPTTLSTLAATTYISDLKRRPPRLILAPGASYPQLADDRPGSVVITFVAGYGATAESVPPDLRSALLAKIGDVYEQRESITFEKPSKMDFVDNIFAQERLY